MKLPKRHPIVAFRDIISSSSFSFLQVINYSLGRKEQAKRLTSSLAVQTSDNDIVAPPPPSSSPSDPPQTISEGMGLIIFKLSNNGKDNGKLCWAQEEEKMFIRYADACLGFHTFQCAQTS